MEFREGNELGDWYYIGHYGQLGPLTREQMDELIQGSVIASDTYVWRAGMTDWIRADRASELASSFKQTEAFLSPPPPPSPGGPPPMAEQGMRTPMGYGQDRHLQPMAGYYPAYSGVKSDRNRLAAGLLQLFLPGVGRMYLGYVAYGILQLVLTFATCGVLSLWSFIDGIIILSGGVKMDGYGRRLPD